MLHPLQELVLAQPFLQRQPRFVRARFQLGAAAKLLCPFLHVPGCVRLLMGSPQPELGGNSRLATVAGSLCCAGFASISLLGGQNPPKSCCSPPSWAPRVGKPRPGEIPELQFGRELSRGAGRARGEQQVPGASPFLAWDSGA